LVAGQGEFPSAIITPAAAGGADGGDDAPSSEERQRAVNAMLATQLCLPLALLESRLRVDEQPLGEFTHVFSHRKHHMRVSSTVLDLSMHEDKDDEPTRIALARAMEDRAPAADEAATATVSTGKKRPAASTSKKNNSDKRAKNDNKRAAADDSATDDEPDESVAAAGAPSFNASPRAYRWVPMAMLADEPHRPSNAAAVATTLSVEDNSSTLGLSSGVVKVVELMKKAANNSGGGSKNSSNSSASKKKGKSTNSGSKSKSHTPSSKQTKLSFGGGTGGVVALAVMTDE
jgi:hypothetical protein